MRDGCEPRERSRAASLRRPLSRPAPAVAPKDAASPHASVLRTEGAIALYDDAIEHFLDEGLIERVIRPIKSGKEASVHRAAPIRARPARSWRR